MGIIEKADHHPTHSRIAFRVTPESMLALEASLRKIGAAKVERSEDMDQYPAIFFEDAAGTKLEIVARLPAPSSSPADRGGMATLRRS